MADSMLVAEAGRPRYGQPMNWLDVYPSHTVGRGRLDPSSPEAARIRLDTVAPSLPLPVGDAPTWTHSSVNNVWRIEGGLFLRISFRGDRMRLRREAELLKALPRSVPHLDVLDVGATEDLEWMITLPAPGTNLAADADITQEQLHARVSEFGGLLRDLHQWTPPPHIVALLRDKQTRIDNADALGIVAADLVPVPLTRTAKLVAPLKTLPFVDHGLIDAALERLQHLEQYAPAAEEYSSVIHGDAGPANVLVDNRRVTAVLDFEFARLAPPDLELIGLIRGLDARRTMGGDAPPLLAWLAEGYPELFTHHDLRERLWLYGLTFALETILFWPPNHPEAGDLHPAHPLRSLRRLLEAPYEAHW